ncbi:hypothetical protein JKG47_03575 [Acidithiobacillus sp. MC6.1]|nr:hypothetical protein [Acidithiobacillus sp. MC6.1]
MDINTIDQQYNQLQAVAQGVSQALQVLAGKMQQGAENNPDAREWLLDLKQLALNIQQEQMQVMNVMRAVHQAMQNDFMQNQNGGQWQPGYPQTPQAGFAHPQPQGSGFLGNFLNSGFGHAIEMGAGFGIGDDLLNRIF